MYYSLIKEKDSYLDNYPLFNYTFPSNTINWQYILDKEIANETWYVYYRNVLLTYFSSKPISEKHVSFE